MVASAPVERSSRRTVAADGASVNGAGMPEAYGGAGAGVVWSAQPGPEVDSSQRSLCKGILAKLDSVGMATERARHAPTSDRADPVVLDSRSLRGIAHPLRVRLLGLLRDDGPSTASKLAVRIGTSSAATSYHLRQLAVYGFVVEDEPVAGDGRQPRERWWRAAHRMTHFDPAATVGNPEDEAAAEVYLRSVVQSYARRMEAALDESWSLPEWRDTGTFSDWTFVYDASMTKELLADLVAVIDRHAARPELPPTDGRRPVSVQLQVFPRPDWTSKEVS